MLECTNEPLMLFSFCKLVVQILFYSLVPSYKLGRFFLEILKLKLNCDIRSSK